MSEYWRMSLEGALDRCEINATSEQIEELAGCCKGIADVERQYTGEELISDPMKDEVETLKKRLATELARIVCPECRGIGSFRIDGPSHYSNHTCRKCGGRGIA